MPPVETPLEGEKNYEGGAAHSQAGALEKMA